MSAIKIISSLLFVSSSAMAAVFDVPVEPGDKLIIKGMNAQVMFSGKSGANALKISGAEKEGTEGTYVAEKKNGVITVQMKELSGKKAWQGALKTGVLPEVKLSFQGKPLPTEVYLKSGQVTSQAWNQAMKVNLTEGKVSITDSKGDVGIFLQKGTISISGHQGNLNYDLYSGTGSVKNAEGRLKINQFAGTLAIEKMKGSLGLSSSQATVSVVQGNGTIDFDAVKGNVAFKGFQGRMEGNSLASKVTADLTLDSELDVRTKTGDVSVTTASAGAYDLNLLTVEGEITVPGTIRVIKLSSEKSARGKLRGDATRGSVFVRSQEGAISVK